MFQLEGRLSGPWIDELDKCWRRVRTGESKSVVRIDLTDVSFVDDAGKAYLAAMHREGVEFVTADCLTKGIVAEIADQNGSPHR
jgi:hypothetical protein